MGASSSRSATPSSQHAATNTSNASPHSQKGNTTTTTTAATSSPSKYSPRRLKEYFKQKKKSKRGRIDRARIGQPTNFQHVGHGGGGPTMNVVDVSERPSVSGDSGG